MRDRIFTAFTSLKDHETQNVYLCGYISVNPDIKIHRRPRKEDAKERSSFSYSVTAQEQTASICKAAFLSMHGIKESRLKRKLLNFSVSLADKQAVNIVNTVIIKISTKIFEKLAFDHIRMFPAHESHYSRSKNLH